ncbi:hypothetical protein [Brevundimonas sp.]|uniref:hypothetical protein n=1 Tax=Brevundimonas sp. TaxID=1871086 RepID=UPI0025FFC106|nr:hypothetical protein [Brevundimonas sp.]
MVKFRWIALCVAVALATPVVAQDAVEEIVVTGARLRRDAEDRAPPVVPAVTVPRRADNLIVQVRVVNDTRDATERRRELIQTLRDMARAAGRQGDIDLSVQENGQLVPFTEEMIGTLTLGVDGSRADTSATSFIVKTPIRPGDTLDSASGRIEAFVGGINGTGRTLVTITGGWQLSIVNPSQYRPQVLAAIATNARETSTAFGDGYAVNVDGMANPLTWIQSGPLELALFIPYTMTVTPRP